MFFQSFESNIIEKIDIAQVCSSSDLFLGGDKGFARLLQGPGIGSGLSVMNANNFASSSPLRTDLLLFMSVIYG